MENPTTPQPQTQAQPIIDSTPSVPPKKSSILVWILIILLILSLGGLAFLAFQNFQLQGQLTQTKQTEPLNNTPTPTTVSSKFYFDLPEGWVTSTQQIDSANPTPILGTKVTKGSWTVEFATRSIPEFLGGQGPVDIDFNTYKTADIFGRTALITKVEDGYLPFIGGDAPEGKPRPITVFFQRHQGETDSTFTTPDSPNNYVLLFTTNDPNNQTNIAVTIYSDELTEDNIKNLKIDRVIMNEIYQIIASAKLI